MTACEALGLVILAMLGTAGLCAIVEGAHDRHVERRRRKPVTHVPRAIIVRAIKGKH